ncbi:MAG: lysostaphin resistance A-like protein [Haloplanus sp.]
MATGLVVAAMLHLLAGLVFASLVHQDAARRGSEKPMAWAVGVFLTGAVGAVGYYLLRARIGPASAGGVPAPLPVRLGSLGRAVLVIFAAFLSATAIAGIGGNLLVGAGLVAPDSIGLRVALSVLQFVGFGVGVGVYLAITDDWDLLQVRRPTLTEAGWMAGGVVLILVAQATIGQALSILGVQVAQNEVVVAGQQDPRFFLYMIPVSLLLVGPFEELVFRGTVQSILRRTWGSSVAVVVASVLFGLAHWVALTGGGGSRVPYITIAAMLGLVLGFAYERTRNLLVPAVVHGVYNSVLFAIQYAAATRMLG